MHPASEQHIPDGLLAASVLLNEKPCQGFETKNPALHPGIHLANSTAALGVSWSVVSRTCPTHEMGRFMSPDWSAKEDPVPYAKLDDPQTLNLYGYVRNNPLSKADPDGHCPTCIEGAVEGVEVGAEVGTFFGPVGTAVGAFAGGLIGGGIATYVSYKAAEHFASGPVQPAQPAQTQSSPEEHQAEPEPQTSTSGAGARQGGNGTIYKVPGSGTASGKPYIGRHNKPNPSQTRKSKDGRDRSQAEVVDTYNASDTTQGRQKEQQQIDAHGGVTELDNKRNEIKKTPQ